MRRGRGIPSFLIIVLIVFFLASVVMQANTVKEKTYSELMKDIKEEKVSEVTLSSDGGRALVKYKENDGSKYDEFQVNIPSLTAFMNAVEEDISNGSINVKEESPSAWITFLDYLTPISLVIIFRLTSSAR